MRKNDEGRSATIIPFPVRGRATGSVRCDESKSVVHCGAPRYSMIASGSGWYHEAAMAEEAQQAREH